VESPAPAPSYAPPASGERILIVTGDDFGLSSPVNAAIVRAHREGILTATSLMVNEPAFEEAVELARATPSLGVGLHLALSGSRSTLPPSEIPSLVDEAGRFPATPGRAGWRYYLSRRAKLQLEREIRAQIEKFLSTGLPVDHIDGHHHLHEHPSIFPLLVRACGDYKIPALRVVRDRLRLSLQVDPGRLLWRLAHWTAFGLLGRRCRRTLEGLPIRRADTVLGLYLDSRMRRDQVLGILEWLPPGVTELYSHPALSPESQGPSGQMLEFQALIDLDVRAVIGRRGIRLSRYGALEGPPTFAAR
jgi:hopanoid biosynthesis associated protein HpnK